MAMLTPFYPWSQALEALDDDIALIDMEQRLVAWCSTSFNGNYPTITMGSTLDLLFQEFADVEAALDQFVQSDGRLECNAAIEIRSLDRRYLLLRFSSRMEQAPEIQRYLEDRQQLFLTSRTLSVSEMATTLAHEINQPIGIIRNLLHGIELRLQSGNAGDSIFVALERAIEQTEFAAKIINRIRDYTQARVPKKSLLDLGGVLRECRSLLDWELHRQNINCQLILPSIALDVVGDELMLQQVFINLLRNAIDAMQNADAEKTLLIRVQLENQHFSVHIEDSGCGLDPDIDGKLFQPFVSSKPTGMGVGLNICRSFLELHQGRLWLTANESTGCTSHVVLPAAEMSEHDC